MRVIPQGAGRHKWTRYYAVRAKGVDSSFAPRAFFSMDGFRMEAPLYLVDGAGTSSQLFVIAFPYLETGKQAVDLLDERERLVWHVAFTSRSFDVGNSITCRIRPSLTKLMRGIELAHSKQSAFIEPIGVYPFDSEHEVIRIRVSYPEGVADIHLDPVRVLVNERAAESLVLECGVGDDGHHHVIMSYRLRKNAGGLLFATSGGDGFLPWIFYLSPDYRSRMVHEFAEMTRDAAGDESYPMWFEKQRASEEALMEQRSHRFPFEPLMSIVVPVYNVPLDFLKDCIRSIRVQSYAAWELIVANADSGNNEVSSWLEEAASHDSRIVVVNLPENKGIVGNTNAGIQASAGDYICFVDQDDIIEPDALFEYVRYINEHPDVGALYCDEDGLISETGVLCSPRFKPDFNRGALYSHNYVVHMLAVRRGVIEHAGLSPKEVEGSQDYDLTLKASEVAPLGHVPRVLYHWRLHEGSTSSGNANVKPYAVAAGIHALESHFERCSITASVKTARSPYTYRVDYPVAGSPKVSVIIPTKDHADLLDSCVTTLLAKAGWSNLEILLIDNNSKNPMTFTFYEELIARDPSIRVLHFEGAFNYSKIVNWAAAQATGDYLFILNNDTEALSEDIIRMLLGQAQQPDVGVVGPLLLFPDGLVQTAGIALMADGRLGFLNQNLTLATHGGYLASLECPRDCSAVLGAAQMVSKAIFVEVGGYNENLAVTYNDVDFCWRVREAGKRVVYTPHAQMMHREFATRGRDAATPEKAAQTAREAKLMRDYWPDFFANGDPELNPECDPTSPWYKLS